MEYSGSGCGHSDGASGDDGEKWSTVVVVVVIVIMLVPG